MNGTSEKSPPTAAVKPNRAKRAKRGAANQPPASPVGTDEELRAIVQLIVGQGRADREHVGEEVRHTAAELLDHLRSIKTSPTMADVLDRLSQTASMARKLQIALTKLDPLTRELMSNGLKASLHPSKWQRRFMERAGRPPAMVKLSCTPNPAAAISMDLLNWHGPDAAHPLRAMERAADSVAIFFKGKDTGRGGPGNLRQRIGPNPYTWLAVRAAQWVASAQGAQVVTGTADGLVYRISADVWHYATGMEVRSSALAECVKKAAKAVRQDFEARDRTEQYNTYPDIRYASLAELGRLTRK
jgi:hypothetical protein